MWRFAPLVVLCLVAQAAPTPGLVLEIRAFHGMEDVTAQTRITIHRAGERGQPVAQIGPGRTTVAAVVAPGIYDAQAVREREGRVVNIRWAERLVVMPYPDEGGKHLEVINFTGGYGALQVRGASAPDARLFGSANRGSSVPALVTADYTLFVAPAGQYDLLVPIEGRNVWHHGLDVPADRTRFWIAR